MRVRTLGIALLLAAASPAGAQLDEVGSETCEVRLQELKRSFHGVTNRNTT